jgi:hypothetical protein
VSANAYLGAEPIASALAAGAQIVVCGRVADPSLALGPLVAHFGWSADDWDRLGRGTMAGHLLECGAQVTGGYFADPGVKDVPGLAHVGFPHCGNRRVGALRRRQGRGHGRARERAHGEGAAPLRSARSAAYVTPDVVADISQAEVREVARDRVALEGVRGHPRPGKLKVTVCHDGGWIAEGEISYAGPGAESARGSRATC